MHKLHHPHIIRVYDVFRTQDRMSMVLEYAKYGDLEEKLGQYKKGFPTKMVRPYVLVQSVKFGSPLHTKAWVLFCGRHIKYFSKSAVGLCTSIL